MMVVKGYFVAGVEYVVMDGENFSAGMQSIALLASRRMGIGADRIIVFHNEDASTSIVYDAHGVEMQRTEEDAEVLRHHFGKKSAKLRCCREIRLTSSFVQKLQQVGIEARIAC